MSRRIYSESVKKWALVSGISGVSIIFLIFAFMINQDMIEVHYVSGDMDCPNLENPLCYAIINFTANEDIFIYPVEYDPWGRDTPFDFDPAVKDWKLQRSWGKGWRNIPLDKICTGNWCGLSNKDDTRKFSVVFREGRNYSIRIVGYKYNPSDVIKWSLNPEGYWLSPEEENNCRLISEPSALSSAKINDVSELNSFTLSKGISFTEVKNRKIIGFEKIYDTYECDREVCNYTNNITNGSKNTTNATTDCWNDTYEKKYLTDKKGNPIYSYTNTKALEYGEKRYEFIDKGCFVCDNIVVAETRQEYNGKLMLCFSKKDGYSPGRSEHLKCRLESGESGKIVDLEKEEVLVTNSNWEITIE